MVPYLLVDSLELMLQQGWIDAALRRDLSSSVVNDAYQIPSQSHRVLSRSKMTSDTDCLPIADTL